MYGLKESMSDGHERLLELSKRRWGIVNPTSIRIDLPCLIEDNNDFRIIYDFELKKAYIIEITNSGKTTPTLHLSIEDIIDLERLADQLIVGMTLTVLPANTIAEK